MTFNLFEIVILTLINSGGIFLIIVLSANSLSEKLYRWLAIMTISIIGWVNFAYLGYNETNSDLALLFYRINLIFVSIFFFTEYMLYIEGFSNVIKKFWRYVTLGISVIFILLTIFTDEIIKSVAPQEWGNEAILGHGNDLFGLYALVLNIALIIFFFRRYRKLETLEKSKALFFLIGTFIFIVLNIVFNIVVPQVIGSVRFQHLGDYASVIFLILTAYAILRRQFMNVKIALTALLIGVIGMLIIIDVLALSENLLEQSLKFLILIFFAVISVLLVRSVLREIKQREELAKINKELSISRQRYIDLATEQKDIIDVMGHEIRTPLTAIVQEIKIHKKYTLPIEQQLFEEAKDKPNLTKILPYLLDTVKTVDKASAHAVLLVTDMLETARLDKKRFELNYETFDLVNIVKSNVDLMSKAVDIDDPKIHYEINFIEPEFKEFMVEADKTRISQAIDALLNNAIKYRDQQKDNIVVNVSISKTATHAFINVKDNGLGIQKEDISKLGKKFLRLNPKTNGNLQRPGGTGLGLFVIKGIMEYHHGEMIVQSEGLGQGSTFTLSFPIKKVG